MRLKRHALVSFIFTVSLSILFFVLPSQVIILTNLLYILTVCMSVNTGKYLYIFDVFYIASFLTENILYLLHYTLFISLYKISWRFFICQQRIFIPFQRNMASYRLNIPQGTLDCFYSLFRKILQKSYKLHFLYVWVYLRDKQHEGKLLLKGQIYFYIQQIVPSFSPCEKFSANFPSKYTGKLSVASLIHKNCQFLQKSID